MILLRFGRERRNFMALQRAEEHNIYFRDVYIIHLARRDKKKHDWNAKAGGKKVENITARPLPRCVCSLSVRLAAEQSHRVCSHHQSWFHVLFQLTFTSFLALTPYPPLKLYVCRVGRESLNNPPPPSLNQQQQQQKIEKKGKGNNQNWLLDTMNRTVVAKRGESIYGAAAKNNRICFLE